MSGRIQDKNVHLKKAASKGAFWGLASNVTVSAVSFIGTAIVARILSPNDFGLIGMAALVTGIVQLFGNLGLGPALIHKRDIDDEYLSTAFWSSIAAGCVLTVGAVILAPVASIFFNESLVKWVVISLSVTFIISSLSSIHRTLLYKEVDMKKIAIIEVVSRALRVMIMLACAASGLGFWSIVIGMIVESIFKTTLFFVTARWVPSVAFNVAKFKELFKYGKHLYGQGFLEYLSSNMDFIVTGRVLGVNLLGFYQFSYNIPYLVKSYVQDGLAPIAFPVFSRANDDTDRLGRGLLSAIRYVAIIIFPVMWVLSFCARDFIAVMYGDKWLPAALPLQMLCFAGAIGSVHGIIMPVFRAIGKPEVGFKWGLIKLPLVVVLVVISSRWGINGVALAMLIVELLASILVFYALKLLRLTFTKYLGELAPAACSACVMVAILYLLNTAILEPVNLHFRLAINFIIGVSIYAVSMYLMFRKDLLNTLSFISLCFK